ncbi:hypothetical protein L917_20030, partial [Phytophthora nicotianae]
ETGSPPLDETRCSEMWMDRMKNKFRMRKAKRSWKRAPPTVGDPALMARSSTWTLYDAITQKRVL